MSTLRLIVEQNGVVDVFDVDYEGNTDCEHLEEAGLYGADIVGIDEVTQDIDSIENRIINELILDSVILDEVLLDKIYDISNNLNEEQLEAVEYFIDYHSATDVVDEFLDGGYDTYEDLSSLGRCLVEDEIPNRYEDYFDYEEYAQDFINDEYRNCIQVNGAVYQIDL